jgi:acyl-CoA dehydrogenase
MFLFNQGPTRGLGKIVFHDYGPVFEANKGLPNVAAFMKQIDILKEMLEKAGPDQTQDMDPSWSLPLGEMFSIVVYGQLILEQAGIGGVDSDIVNQVFDFMVRDFAQFAMQVYGNHGSKDAQRAYCAKIMLSKAAPNPQQYERVWEQYVSVLSGEYAMNE